MLLDCQIMNICDTCEMVNNHQFALRRSCLRRHGKKCKKKGALKMTMFTKHKLFSLQTQRDLCDNNFLQACQLDSKLKRYFLCCQLSRGPVLVRATADFFDLSRFWPYFAIQFRFFKMARKRLRAWRMQFPSAAIFLEAFFKLTPSYYRSLKKSRK